MKNTTKISLKRMLLVIAFICFWLTGFSQTKTQYNTSGTYTVPVGQIHYIKVEAWGGGGRGGTRTSTGNQAGGGGGSGAYAQSYLYLTAGTYDFTVGNGSSSSSDGEDSSFESLVIAKGGKTVGNSSTGGLGGTGSTGTITKAGGNGANGTTSALGGGGGGGGAADETYAANNGSGTTGGSNFLSEGGNGGNGRSALSAGAGSIGQAPGGGGGGCFRTNASGNQNGGNGGKGRVTITVYNPDINLFAISTPTGNIIDGATTTSTTNFTDFGSQATAGTGSVTRTFTIQNTAAAAQLLALGTITISGEGAADFTVTQAVSTLLNGGTSTTFTIKFNPVNAGTRNAVISIPNTDFNENPYTFAITGIGTGPEMDVQGNGISIPDGDVVTALTDNTNLGTQYITTGTLSKTFTIKNTGTSNLNLSGSPRVTLTGGATEFTVTAQPSSPVASNGSTTFTITFDPTAAGVRNATVNIINNDDNENPYNFAISATGSLYIDSDGDGITDEADIDDDNDGIIDTEEEVACKTSPIATSVETVFLNEDFGTGTSRVQINTNIPTASTGYNYSASGNVNDGDYTVYQSTDVATWRPNVWWLGNEDHTPGDTNGRMAIFNAEATAGRVFYTTEFDGLTPGIPVKYSFYIMNIDRYIASGTYASAGRPLPNVIVEFRRVDNNAYIAGITTGNLPQNTASVNWIQFTNTFTTPTSAIKVIFKNNAPGGAGNDLALDDILITQTYCDLDSDGDADIFDLDDDNDGIPDIVEGGFKAYSANKSRMDITDGSIWKDSNANGMNDNIDPEIIGSPAYQAMLVDSDGDGVKDFMDLDSDNDSLFDIDEAQVDTFSAAINGDGDIDGDGRGDGVDADKDGIQDVNDDLVGYGTTFKPYPTDTDGDGFPDYMDATSDGSHYDIYNSIYSDLDADNDGKIDSTTDFDKDGVMDTFDGDPNVIGSPRNITTKKLLIDFDGRNDYAEGSNVLSSLTAGTIMGWVKVDAAFANAAVLFGQDNFMINISSSRRLFITAKGSGTVSTTTGTATELAVNRWYHVAAVYNPTSATEKLVLYINGAQQATSSSALVNTNLAASTTKFTMAKNSANSTLYFRGFLDEVRVFNRALTSDQLLPMICQELDVDASLNVYGTTLTKAFTGTTSGVSWTIPWTSMLAYYKLNIYKGDVIDDYKTNTVIDAGSATTLARIYNVKYLRTQTAPLPFVTYNTGLLNTAASTNNTSDFVYGPTTGSPFPGAIVNIKHNVSSTGNLTFTGLVVDSGRTLTIDNTTKMENSWYLQINGKIDLVGKSQLVQTANSDLAVTSSGSLERDQQGTKNIYSYNYWSSPVSSINNTTINHGYTVSGVFKDGTTGTPRNITFTSSFDGAAGNAGTPVTISRRWIYKFQNLTSSYANWSVMGETGTFLAGQGFTMKGSGTSTTDQNYVFVGKPNNGTINSTVGPNNINLSGNPYPSAIDSNQFMYDNIPASNPLSNSGTSGSLTGTLYLWEQSTTNNSHVGTAYQGGYATISLTGRVKAGGTLAAAGGLGDAQKVPGQYIPVGQGFFVEASTTGGQIRFKNSQRAFQTEDGGSSNTLFRNATMTMSDTDNSQDPIVSDTIKRVRIGFEAHNNYQRQLLLGFMNEYASDAYEPGFDAPIFDDNPVDMYFVNEANSLVIQGVGTFQTNSIYPLGVKTDVIGNVKMRLDGLENMDSEQEIYIYDAITQQYHDIRTEDFVVSLEPGTYNNRFSLRFANSTLGVNDPQAQNQIEVAYTNNNSVLSIFNNDNLYTSINSVSIFNIIGQQMNSWEIENPTAKTIELPVKNLATGTYIIKVATSNSVLAKKIIIK